jgi:hypothetical protein
MGCEVKMTLIAEVGLALPIHQRQRSTLNEKTVALQLLSSHGSADRIMHDVHQYHNVCARWVSRRLASELQKERMDDCKELLRRYQTDRNHFFSA